jgi:hypothetical protein
VTTDTGLPSGGEMSLANSARAVIGPVLEDTGFLVRPEGALFVVLHQPADRPPVGSLTVCSSLFAELHTDYRREVRLARMLASAGIAVARFHYRGVGNSAPAAGSLDAFTRDALDMTLAVQRMTSASHTAFFGTGVGSLVASGALLGYPKAPLVLWKPVVNGSQFCRDLFRARLFAATRLDGPRPPATEELLAEMASAGHVDVMGFRLDAGLYDSLMASRLTETLPRQARPILIQPFRGARAAGAQRLASDWSAAGCRTDVRPVKLAEDPWFIPDGADIAASILATEEELMTATRDWLLSSLQEGE